MSLFPAIVTCILSAMGHSTSPPTSAAELRCSLALKKPTLLYVLLLCLTVLQSPWPLCSESKDMGICDMHALIKTWPLCAHSGRAEGKLRHGGGVEERGDQWQNPGHIPPVPAQGPSSCPGSTPACHCPARLPAHVALEQARRRAEEGMCNAILICESLGASWGPVACAGAERNSAGQRAERIPRQRC